jgi:antitoxin CptB
MDPCPAPAGADALHAPDRVDARRLARIRWRARRGMLENDLVLARFLDRRGADLTEAEIGALDRLLDLPDNELWDRICGRGERDATLQPMLDALSRA